MKVSHVAFCANACREAAKVICAETKIPYEHYKNLMDAYSLLDMALLEVKQEITVEKEAV